MDHIVANAYRDWLLESPEYPSESSKETTAIKVPWCYYSVHLIKQDTKAWEPVCVYCRKTVKEIHAERPIGERVKIKYV